MANPNNKTANKAPAQSPRHSASPIKTQKANPPQTHTVHPLAGEPQKTLAQISKAPREWVQVVRTKDPAQGELTWPLFVWAKMQKQNPQKLAEEFCQTLNTLRPPWLNRAQALRGYLNLYLSDQHLGDQFFAHISTRWFWPLAPKQRAMPAKPNTTVVVDFSSPNVAKPMHLGHLRATVVGRSICELARTQGHKVIGLNHLGDWGSQFGALICAYKKWHNAYSFERADAFESLYALYVRFHKESTPELKAQGAKEFKKLEQGDAQNTKLWQEFKKLSLKEYNKIWRRLDVKHDLLLPESFYNDKLSEVRELLLKYDLLKKDQGALIVALPPPLPPCLIAKSDGASLYATRDIAAALYRMQKLKATHNFYVVGSEQKLHFKQVFGVLAQLPAQFQNCQHKHISFGRYRFLDSGMSSRKGQIVRAEDVLRQAKERVIKIIKAKNPTCPI